MTAAIDEARSRADDGVVAVCAGEVGGQAVARGLVDVVAMDVVLRGDRVLDLRYGVRR